MDKQKILLASAREADKTDPLSGYRNRFVIDDRHTIYLDGNSLGRLPAASLNITNQTIREQWGKELINSWNTSWMSLSGRLAAKIAKLVGAKPEEIMVGDSTSLNLFKLVLSALKMQKGRSMIISDTLNFPSDLYVLEGVIDLIDQHHRLMLLESIDGIEIPFETLKAALTADAALLTLSHVAFKSAFMYDMHKITKAAHDAGALVLWDLSHAVGAVPIDLNRSDADLAVGCTYKYLNGGPGAPAFLYVRKDLQDSLTSYIRGWFGAAKPFEFDLHYRPAEGIQKFYAGTPHILSLSALEPALDIHLEAGMDSIRRKSILQTEYMIQLTGEWLTDLGFHLGSPMHPDKRGSHVSIKHPEGYRICQALINGNELRVIPDFRTPDNIRLGVAPLYTSFEEIFRAIRRIREIVLDREYEAYSAEPAGVT